MTSKVEVLEHDPFSDVVETIVDQFLILIESEIDEAGEEAQTYAFFMQDEIKQKVSAIIQAELECFSHKGVNVP